MRDFRTIQRLLGYLPDIQKVYLIGSTGAGKSSLVQHIMGTTKLSFPTTTQRRTTIAPTEYVIKRDIPFKTTIILKEKKDILISIEELIHEAIKKSLEDNVTVADVIYEFEQSPDERFKLKHIVTNKTFTKNAQFLVNEIAPKLKERNLDLDNETLFTNQLSQEVIKKITKEFISEIEINFKNSCGHDYNIFSKKPLIINGIHDKESFINANKKLLKNEFGSISALVEYARIEGNLLADWLDNKLEFVLIDGEGIGHSYGEKRDTLSARHYDYFDFCNNIILVGDAEEPFATGGQGVIESIFLNGYQNKFRLVFSKVDKIEHSDVNGYLRRNISNLKTALKKDKIEFNIENKDAFKLQLLNHDDLSKQTEREISKLLHGINEAKESNPIPLEYDFNSFFSSLEIDHFKLMFENTIDWEHWATVKAFNKRIFNCEVEYRHLKPLSWILTFIMRDINVFLKRDDELRSEICDSQNQIKQKFSKKLRGFIYNELIINRNHLWQQAYEKCGIGSHKERKKFIFDNIMDSFLPHEENHEQFELFKNQIKQLLIESGAREKMEAKRVVIKNIKIKKIFGRKNIDWSLDKNVNILIGKNGCGKSTILKLIYACLKNDKEILDYYGHPYIELTILKEFENGETQESKITSSKLSNDINVEFLNTFDSKIIDCENNLSYLDNKLKKLTSKFVKYQRNLNQLIKNKTEALSLESKKILDNISKAGPDELVKFQELSITINQITDTENKPLLEFKKLIDQYFSDTNKELIIDDEQEPLLVSINDNPEESKLITLEQLSSGEKQLLIIFISVILSEGKSFIMLMDEPETSLHVEWQSTFIDKIRSLNPDIQLITATHNPLILLNRSQDEIGVINAVDESVQRASHGTKYLDISSILLRHFKLSSLIGSDMQLDIKRFTELKLKKDKLSDEENAEMLRLSKLLEDSFAGDIIYNEKYFNFLRFIKDHKEIDFDTYQSMTTEEVDDLLSDFGDFFND